MRLIFEVIHRKNIKIEPLFVVQLTSINQSIIKQTDQQNLRSSLTFRNLDPVECLRDFTKVSPKAEGNSPQKLLTSHSCLLTQAACDLFISYIFITSKRLQYVRTQLVSSCCSNEHVAFAVSSVSPSMSDTISI